MSFYQPNPSPYGGSHTGYGNFGNAATIQQPYEHSWSASHNGYARPQDQQYLQYNQQNHNLHFVKPLSGLQGPNSVSPYEAAISSMRTNNSHPSEDQTNGSIRKIMPAPPAIKYAPESRLEYAQHVDTNSHSYSFAERDSLRHYSSANYLRAGDLSYRPLPGSESWLGPSYGSQETTSQVPPPSQNYHGFAANGYEDSWFNAPRQESRATWGHATNSVYPRPPPPIVTNNSYSAYPSAGSGFTPQSTRFDTAKKSSPNYSRNTSGNRGFSHGNKRGQSNSGRGFGNNWRQTPSSSNSEKSSLTGANNAALTPPDFEKLELPDVKKDFYSENDHLADRDSDEIDDFLDDFNISLSGRYQPRPCMSFEDIDLPEEIQNVIRNKNYEKPTPIQAQTWPIALSGDNMVGIAQTGSGKTCAFVIPGLVHILNNKEIPREPGCPLMLALCPTRELAQQVAQVTEEFASAVGLNTVCVYGGVPRNEQAFDLERKNPEILVATPGRLIDFMETKQVDVKMVSYLVLDEADRMLDMGFEPQIRTIITNIRPQRQTLMFSATWPDEVWQLAKDFLDNYTKVNVGSQKLSANHQITQVIECCEEEEKPGKILELLKTLTEQDQTLRTLIFCDTKKAVNELHKSLNDSNYRAECIHGNKKQTDREFVLKQFAENKVPILIATDVAARGLDISDIKHVINYDYPNNSEDYVHRIGRTARGATTGVAYTFFTQSNMGQSGKLISILEEANQEVPTMLKFYANFVKQR